MPENSERIHATQRVRITKTARVPAQYAYRWLTDYRPEDSRFSRLRPRYRVIRVSKDRVVRIRTHREKTAATQVAVDLVRFDPPHRWHVDQIDEDDLNSADFDVQPVGARKTRIRVAVLERWMTPQSPTLSELRERLSDYWDRIVAGLEQDYRRGRPPTG